MDRPAPYSPRNAWGHIGDALHADPANARRLLESLRFHPEMSPGLYDLFERQIAARLPQGGLPPKVNSPADFMANDDGLLRVPFRRLEAGRNLPRPYPPDLALPPLPGVGNDFRFLHQAAASMAARADAHQTRVHVFCTGDVATLSDLARQQTSALVKVTVFAPTRDPAQEAAIAAYPQKVTVIEAPILSQRASDYMAQALPDADLILFLSNAAKLDTGAIDRAVYFGRISDMLVQPLLPVSGELGMPTPYAVKSTRHPFGHDLPYRQLRGLNMAVPVALLERAGGPDATFASDRAAAHEMGFRLHNMGAYFAPLLVPELDTPNSDIPAADTARLTQLCPNIADRPEDGDYQVPKVSIYIPTYNASKYIERAVESVLEQDVQDLEVCLANDGSPDTTLEVLQKAFGDDPRVRWEDGANGGIGHASNRAVSMTRGIYIGQLDSDDCLKPGAVRQLMEYLDTHPDCVCCYGSCERIDAKGDHIRNEYSWPVFSREKMLITSIAHHFRMFRRAAWERTGKFRTDIVNAVDYDMFLKLSETGKFHHIDRIMYQRRWHGQNTSYVQERSQTTNTYRVQTLALRRQGLEQYWETHLPNPDEPRWVSYRNKGAGARVFFFPNYDGANPYQSLLYRGAAQRHEIAAGNIAAALTALRQGSGPQRVIFHLHWLNFLFRDIEKPRQARRVVAGFIKDLEAFKREGGRIVWTVHNIISHDAAFPKLEVELSRRLAELADVVHLHSAASLPEVQEAYHIPPQKMRISRHGSYVGCYPDFVTRDQARQTLGITADADAILFAGQVRPYKGVGRLITAFRKVLAERPKATLIIAGAMHHDVFDHLRPALTQAERDRILISDRFLDDPELQLVFRAADLAVFPYARILTSGSLLLSLSFGLPAVVPQVGMTQEVLDGTDAGITYDVDRDGTLLAAIQSLLARKDDGTLGQMSAAARARAEEMDWPDLSHTLLSGL